MRKSPRSWCLSRSRWIWLGYGGGTDRSEGEASTKAVMGVIQFVPAGRREDLERKANATKLERLSFLGKITATSEYSCHFKLNRAQFTLPSGQSTAPVIPTPSSP